MDNQKNQKSTSKYIKLEDYKVFDYEIPEIFLDFVIKKNAVNVTTKLKLVKRSKNTNNLILDGTDILIKSESSMNILLINISVPSRIRFLVFLFLFTNLSFVVT